MPRRNSIDSEADSTSGTDFVVHNLQDLCLDSQEREEGEIIPYVSLALAINQLFIFNSMSLTYLMDLKAMEKEYFENPTMEKKKLYEAMANNCFERLRSHICNFMNNSSGIKFE